MYKAATAVALMVLMALGAPPPAAGDGPRTYNLRIRPVFRTGDGVDLDVTEERKVTLTGPDGRGAHSRILQTKWQVELHVLATDDVGLAKRLRVILRGGVRKVTASGRAQHARDKTVTLENIHAVATRQAEAFAVDVATLAAQRAIDLTASQVAMLKDICRQVAAAPFGTEPATALLPVGLVGVGHTWQPDRQAVLRWLASRRAGKGAREKLVDAAFKLQEVADDVARVRGQIRLRVEMEGSQFGSSLMLSHRMDVTTGRRLSRASVMLVEQTVKGGTLSLEAASTESIRYRPGAGTAATMPAELNPLGWKAPGPDLNSFTSPAAGVSLNVPKAYTQLPEAEPPAVARFAGPSDATVTISLRRVDWPVDLPDLVPQVKANLARAIAGYAAVEQRKLFLPDNVPAVLLVGKGLDGKAVVFCVLAVDDLRVVDALAAAPAAKLHLVEQARRIVSSLRVFAPADE